MDVGPHKAMNLRSSPVGAITRCYRQTAHQRRCTARPTYHRYVERADGAASWVSALKGDRAEPNALRFCREAWRGRRSP